MSYLKFSLPYTVEDTSRGGKSFTSDLETSALVCLAEGQRQKRGLLGSPSEDISFISKIHYPLWAIPWADKCLILDSLGTASYKNLYSVSPNTMLFVEDLIRSSSSRENFLGFLKKHKETFNDFVSTIEVSCNTVIGNKSLLSALSEYLKQGTPLNEDTQPVSIPLEINLEAASDANEKLIRLWKEIKADIKGFQYALNVLEKETKIQERCLLFETEFLREKYENKISEFKPTVEKKVKNIMKKREAEIAKIIKSTEKRLKAASKEREKCEFKLKTLERKKILLQKKGEASKRKGNKQKPELLSYELKKFRSEVDEIKGKIEASSNLIERTKKEKEDNIKEVEKIYRIAIEQEEAKITDLETLRDLKIATNEIELKELTSRFSYIKSLIEQLIEKKRHDSSKLQEETAISWKLDGVTLIYLPFYLTKYEKGSEVRYSTYPPMLAMGYKSALRIIQRAILGFSLKTRIARLLYPRSTELSKLFSSTFIKKIKANKSFEEKISKICVTSNLLNSTGFSDTLARGIRKLAGEGWVTPKEATEILNKYGGIR